MHCHVVGTTGTGARCGGKSETYDVPFYRSIRACRGVIQTDVIDLSTLSFFCVLYNPNYYILPVKSIARRPRSTTISDQSTGLLAE
jgi:hypothetical protein